MQMLYVEIYVSSLLAVFIYVLVELFNVENEKNRPAESKAAADPRRSPAWFFRAGIASVAIGIFAFCASAAVEGVVKNGDPSVVTLSLVAGIFNPFFFAGVPLGIYWLNHSKRTSV